LREFANIYRALCDELSIELTSVREEAVWRAEQLHKLGRPVRRRLDQVQQTPGEHGRLTVRPTERRVIRAAL